MAAGRVLVTGSSGHLGEALVRALRAQGREVFGLDALDSPFTDRVGSITDRAVVKECIRGAQSILRTATLHKPHVGTHDRQAFIETNVIGTTVLLEEAVAAGVICSVFTSTTSVFGRALVPSPRSPIAWITEEVDPLPRNIYGVSKTAAEDVCELVARDHGLPVVVLRTSRFFPETDDNSDTTSTFVDGNIEANEFLYRHVDIEDVVNALLLAEDRAAALGFGKYIISATSPFTTRMRMSWPEMRRRSSAASFPTRLLSTLEGDGGCSLISTAFTTTLGLAPNWVGYPNTTFVGSSTISSRTKIRESARENDRCEGLPRSHNGPLYRPIRDELNGVGRPTLPVLRGSVAGSAHDPLKPGPLLVRIRHLHSSGG